MGGRAARPTNESRIELLSAREDAHDLAGLRDDVHHRLDRGWALDHPAAAAVAVAFSGMIVSAAAMVVVSRPTLFR